MKLDVGSIDSPVEKTQEEEEEGEGDSRATDLHMEDIWKTPEPVHGDVDDPHNPSDRGAPV